MDKNAFDYITKNLTQDGVKKACYIVREYARCENFEELDSCAVTKEDYKFALEIVLAYAYSNSDENTKVDLYNCQEDCDRNNGTFGFCPGEFELGSDHSRKRCKYYIDSSNK